MTTSSSEHGYWEGGTENFTIERALEWQRQREKRSMTASNLTTDIRVLPLAALVFSETPAQVERRKHLSQEKLEELAESIKSEGLLQPIVVRPLHIPNEFREIDIDRPSFEVVAGERRVRASKMAGKEEILATVRDLTDQQVAKVQLIENLQREDVHPLAEAEGYDELMKKHGYPVDQVATETGKSKAYIYARIKLLALCGRGRDAFYADKISASIALLIARLPIEKWQLEALEHILQPWAGPSAKPLSYREVSDYLQREYMLRLSEAPFPRDDAMLVPDAGTCGGCPKRTGNQPDIFGDVRGGDVCTDRLCFNLKRAAWNKLQVAKAKETGQEIIKGAEARKAQSRYSNRLTGYVRPTDKCDADPKQRTYAQLLGKADVPTALLQNPESGKFSKVYKTADVAKQLAKHGIKIADNTREADGVADTRWQAEQAKREQENLFQRALWAAIYRAAPTQLARVDLEAIARAMFDTGYGPDEELYEALGWETGKSSFDNRVQKLLSGQLNQLLFALTLWPEVSDYNDGKKLLAVAKRLKVDPDQVRQKLATEKAAAPTKASKKKVARK